MVSKLAALCVLALGYLMPLVASQSALSSAASSASSAVASVASSSASSVATRVVTVGNGDHKFRPEVTQADIGDIIEFQFFPPNHSVVRAEYLYPCIPYELTGRSKTGFFSGFHPVDVILSNPPVWRIRINDTNPIFFYCSAVGSCIGYGMVGVINPNASTSLETQRQYAMGSAYMLNPGESFPSEGGSSTSRSSSATVASTQVGTTTVTATPSASTTAAAASDGASSGLSTGAIAGIAVGGVLVLALAGGLFFYMGRSKTLKQEINRNSTMPFGGGPPSSMYQHSSAFMPKSNMTDASSRNSISQSGGIIGGMSHNPPYEVYPGTSPIAVPADKKNDYVIAVDESQLLRSTSPRTPTFNNMDGPRRHPSVLLNPHDPQEMHSPDARYRDNY